MKHPLVSVSLFLALSLQSHAQESNSKRYFPANDSVYRYVSDMMEHMVLVLAKPDTSFQWLPVFDKNGYLKRIRVYKIVYSKNLDIYYQFAPWDREFIFLNMDFSPVNQNDIHKCDLI